MDNQTEDYFIAVGTNTFGEGFDKLFGCANDAKRLAQVFETRYEWRTKEFVDGRAQAAKLLAFLKDLKPSSTCNELNVVLFVATHGCLGAGGDTYLAMHESRANDSHSMIGADALRLALEGCAKSRAAGASSSRCAC